MDEKKAILFDIGRYRNTDGPGIRTILFFKGCPLRCRWCCNPFGLSPKRQLVVNPAKCTGCGTCAAVCPQGVNAVDPETHRVTVAFDRCALCGTCQVLCAAKAREVSGKAYTARELHREAAKDRAFYRRGGGGVTLSGGEVLLQWEVAAEALRLCRQDGMNCCMETSGFAPWDHLWAVARHCHTVFFDLKHMDSAAHKALTGVPNEKILENLARLCRELPALGGRVIVRLPLVPGCNDDDGAVAAAAAFVATLEHRPALNLLPYHDLGASKYEMIGATYDLQAESRSRKDARLQALLALCRETAPDNPVTLGGENIDWT